MLSKLEVEKKLVTKQEFCPKKSMPQFGLSYKSDLLNSYPSGVFRNSVRLGFQQYIFRIQSGVKAQKLTDDNVKTKKIHCFVPGVKAIMMCLQEGMYK